MQISDRVRSLKPSATLTINSLSNELKAQGKDIISLSLGEPDFKTPEVVREAAIAAIQKGYVHYTDVPGTVELRKACANYFNRQYNAGATHENIIVSNGGKHSLYNLFMSLLNPGDEVIIPAPYWVSYPPMVELAGAKSVIACAFAEDGFKVTPEILEKHYTKKTKMLIMNSPSNPTGVVYSQKEVDAIAEWTIQKNIILASDEIYDQLVYTGEPYASFSAWWKKCPENFVIANGASKSFAMTGWRVGYMMANTEIVKACNKLQGQSTSNICAISQAATIAALKYAGDDVLKMHTAFQKRRDLLFDLVSKWDGVFLKKPEGAFYAFVDVHKLYGSKFSDSTGICKYLLQEAGVAIVPGEAFGDDACVRISYATSEELLICALDRIGKALK